MHSHDVFERREKMKFSPDNKQQKIKNVEEEGGGQHKVRRGDGNDGKERNKKHKKEKDGREICLQSHFFSSPHHPVYLRVRRPLHPRAHTTALLSQGLMNFFSGLLLALQQMQQQQHKSLTKRNTHAHRRAYVQLHEHKKWGRGGVRRCYSCDVQSHDCLPYSHK